MISEGISPHPRGGQGRGGRRTIARVDVRAELAGSLWKIVVKEGQSVAAEETLMILESMKMEIPVTAPQAGRVTKIHAAEGQTVHEGQVLAEID